MECPGGTGGHSCAATVHGDAAGAIDSPPLGPTVWNQVWAQCGNLLALAFILMFAAIVGFALLGAYARHFHGFGSEGHTQGWVAEQQGDVEDDEDTDDTPYAPAYMEVVDASLLRAAFMPGYMRAKPDSKRLGMDSRTGCAARQSCMHSSGKGIMPTRHS
jgi:hypothetical protein